MASIADWTNFFSGLLPNSPIVPVYAKLFAENDLDPRIADMITLEMLESLGVKSLGHRLLIKKALMILSESAPFPAFQPSVSGGSVNAPAPSPSPSLAAAPQGQVQRLVASPSASPPPVRAASPRDDKRAPRDKKEKGEEKKSKHKKEKEESEKKDEKDKPKKEEKDDNGERKPSKEPLQQKQESEKGSSIAKECSDEELLIKTGSTSSTGASKGSANNSSKEGKPEHAFPRLSRLCIRAFRDEKTARYAFKAGHFHRLLVLFKHELNVLVGQADKKMEEQMMSEVMRLNLPSARRPSKNEIREITSQRIRNRLKAFGGALSGCFQYQPMRENMIVDLGVETILRAAQQGLLKVHKEISWHQMFALAKKTQIGAGATAIVYRMEMQGKGEIALKVFSDKDHDAFQTCRTELAFQSVCSHPNLVNTFGGCTSAVGSYAVAMEYCSRGTLYELLRDADCTGRLRLQLARGIAMAISYVHSLHIIHRDIKSLNVLITREMVAKLTDFGASTVLAPTMSQGIGSIMWMAPEVLQSKDYSEKADIYSLGIVLWEIMERDLPYPNMRSYQIEKHVLDRKRPPIPSMCPRPYADLMQALWEHKPEKRPSAADAVSSMEALIRSPWVNMPISASEAELQQQGNKGFNAQERQLILDSWQLLSDRHQQLITLFYARFFDILPEVKKLFEHVSNDRMSKKIARTIGAVLSGLSTESLKEADAQKAQKDLYSLGTRHQRYGAKVEYVPAFKQAFMEALGHETMLGSHFSTPTRLAWAKGLKLAADVISSGLQGKPDKPCRIQ